MTEPFRRAPTIPFNVKPFFKPFLFLPVVFLATGCMSSGNDEDDQSIHAIGRVATRSDGEPVMYNVDENDDQMDHATVRAGST